MKLEEVKAETELIKSEKIAKAKEFMENQKKQLQADKQNKLKMVREIVKLERP